jgi:hypothetical protein
MAAKIVNEGYKNKIGDKHLAEQNEKKKLWKIWLSNCEKTNLKIKKGATGVKDDKKIK